MSHLDAGTPVWINNTHPGIKVGTAAITTTPCERNSHGEKVGVRLESGREVEVMSLSVSQMLAEEIPAWAGGPQ